MQCPNCHANLAVGDTYCATCGADVVSETKGIMPFQANLPALLYNSPVSRNVAAGVGALAVGVGLELLRRNLLGRLRGSSSIEKSLPAMTGMKDILFPSTKPTRIPRGYEVQETVVSVRRVIRRG